MNEVEELFGECDTLDAPTIVKGLNPYYQVSLSRLVLLAERDGCIYPHEQSRNTVETIKLFQELGMIGMAEEVGNAQTALAPGPTTILFMLTSLGFEVFGLIKQANANRNLHAEIKARLGRSRPE